MPSPIAGVLLRFAAGLRFPVLFGITAALFLLARETAAVAARFRS